MPLNEINANISSSFPFKTEQNVIKSDWQYSIWGRKQVRVQVTPSGELAVQTVAQNAMAYLASKLLKFLLCNKPISIGKNVTSFTFSGFTLPSNLAVPLSEQKQKELIEAQSRQLALFFLPTHKKLSDLGSELIEAALQDPESCGQAVRKKILDMCQEILDFQLAFTEEIQKDLSPEELFAKFQFYDKQAEKFCKEFPIILKDFIEKNKEVQEPVNEVPIEAPAQLTNKYLELLESAKTLVEELKKRLQFTSADWLEGEIEKTEARLSTEQKTPLSLKLAIESIEDALDCIEEYTDFVVQLQALPLDSPYEQPLKDLVISEIRQTLDQFSNAIDAEEKEIHKLLPQSPWLQDLVRFFETARQKTKMLAENHNSGESSMLSWMAENDSLIPLEALDRHRLIKHKRHVEQYCSSTLNFIKNETQVKKILRLRQQYEELNNLASLKMAQLPETQYLYRAHLAKIKSEHESAIRNISSSISDSIDCRLYVQALEKGIKAIQSKLDEIEEYPEIDLIDQVIELKALKFPLELYGPLRSKLIEDSKVQLRIFVEVLSQYQNILSDAIPILQESHPEMIESLSHLEDAIQSKISQAEALMVDFTTRLHFWQLFGSPVAVDELPMQQLKDYMNTVTHLVLPGIEEINKEAENIGIKFN
jgi:hypothetical protein